MTGCLLHRWGRLGTALCLLFAPYLYGESVGLEFEYASTGLTERDPSRIPLAKYRRMLEMVREAANDPQGVITIQPFSRKEGSQMAVYQDPKGRVWRVTPESVNTGGYDGFELVAPPSRNAEEDAFLGDVVKRVEASGEFRGGLKSSSHVTADVSELTPKEGLCPKIYDFILYVESHWPEIYAAMNPTRYGTYVNRFAVPLALDHPDLLREIASVPASQRTYARLRSIFESFHAKELALAGNDTNKAWKYRAMNYKKLFGLAGTPQADLVELRIGDLATAASLPRRMALMRALVTEGAKVSLGGEFRNPFEGLKRSETFTGLNERIFQHPRERYSAFLSEMKLGETEFPAFDGSKSPPSLKLTREARQKLEAELPTDRPVAFDGHAVTFGFEAEFKPKENTEKLIKDFNTVPKVRTEDYPFLEPGFGRESSGNVEVRSVHSDNLDTTIANMRRVRRDLKDNLKGFHLHMRIPKSAMDRIPEAERLPWLTRIADTIVAWRLQNRKHFFALMVMTQGRPSSPDTLIARHSIRVSEKGDTYDIELRGFMQNEGEIREMARTILLGVKHPELVHGYMEAQERLNQSPVLVDHMDEFMRQHHGRGITPAERAVLNKLQDAFFFRNHHLPLMGFEEAPYLSPLEGRRVADAKFEFMQEMVTLLRNATEHNKYASDKEISKQYRWRIQRWAKKANLEELLNSSLLIPPENATLGERDVEFSAIHELMSSADRAKRAEGRERLAGLPSPRFLGIVNRLIVGASVARENEILLALKARPFGEIASVYDRFLNSRQPQIRDAAFEHLGTLTDPQSRDVLVGWVADTRHFADRSRALQLLANRSDLATWDRSNPVLDAVYKEIDFSLRNGSLQERGQSVELLESLVARVAKSSGSVARDIFVRMLDVYLMEHSPEVRQQARQSLLGHPEWLSREAIELKLRGSLAPMDRIELQALLDARRQPDCTRVGQQVMGM